MTAFKRFWIDFMENTDIIGKLLNCKALKIVFWKFVRSHIRQFVRYAWQHFAQCLVVLIYIHFLYRQLNEVIAGTFNILPSSFLFKNCRTVFFVHLIFLAFTFALRTLNYVYLKFVRYLLNPIPCTAHSPLACAPFGFATCKYLTLLLKCHII